MPIHVTGVGCWPEATSKGFAPLQTTADAPLPTIARKEVLAAPDKGFGRLDDYCKLGLAACSRALRAAGVHALEAQPLRSLPQPCGMVVSTTWGCLGTDLAYLQSSQSPEGGSPHLFAYTLPSILLGETAMRFDLRGPAMALQQAPDEPLFHSLAPVVTAMDFILAGDALAMLAGCCETGLPAQLAGDAPVQRGAVFLLLEKSPPPAYAGPRTSLAQQHGLLCEDEQVLDLFDLLARIRL